MGEEKKFKSRIAAMLSEEDLPSNNFRVKFEILRNMYSMVMVIPLKLKIKTLTDK